MFSKLTSFIETLTAARRIKVTCQLPIREIYALHICTSIGIPQTHCELMDLFKFATSVLFFQDHVMLHSVDNNHSVSLQNLQKIQLI